MSFGIEFVCVGLVFRPPQAFFQHEGVSAGGIHVTSNGSLGKEFACLLFVVLELAALFTEA